MSYRKQQRKEVFRQADARVRERSASVEKNPPAPVAPAGPHGLQGQVTPPSPNQQVRISVGNVQGPTNQGFSVRPVGANSGGGGGPGEVRISVGGAPIPGSQGVQLPPGIPISQAKSQEFSYSVVAAGAPNASDGMTMAPQQATPPQFQGVPMQQGAPMRIGIIVHSMRDEETVSYLNALMQMPLQAAMIKSVAIINTDDAHPKAKDWIRTARHVGIEGATELAAQSENLIVLGAPEVAYFQFSGHLVLVGVGHDSSVRAMMAQCGRMASEIVSVSGARMALIPEEFHHVARLIGAPATGPDHALVRAAIAVPPDASLVSGLMTDEEWTALLEQDPTAFALVDSSMPDADEAAPGRVRTVRKSETFLNAISSAQCLAFSFRGESWGEQIDAVLQRARSAGIPVIGPERVLSHLDLEEASTIVTDDSPEAVVEAILATLAQPKPPQPKGMSPELFARAWEAVLLQP